MANLLLLKDLLPPEYKILGRPAKIIIVSPFKTPLGFIELVAEDKGNVIEIENNDIPYQLELLGIKFLLKKFPKYTSLPVKVEKNKIYLEFGNTKSSKDFIKLAQVIDNFAKDLHEFIQTLVRFPEVRALLTGTNRFVVAMENLKKLKENEKEKKIKSLKAQIVDTYQLVKETLNDIDKDIKNQRFSDAKRKLDTAMKQISFLDDLRQQYKEMTGNDIYEFHSDVIKQTIIKLRKNTQDKQNNQSE